MVGVLIKVGDCVVIYDVRVEAVYEASECVVKSALSCIVYLIMDYVETYVLGESSPFVIIWGGGGDIVPLDDLLFSSMSLLKSPARMMWYVGWLVVSV